MSNPKITGQDIIRIAGFAKIHLDDDEIARFTDDLNDIINHAEALKTIDVNGLEPMVSPLSGSTPLREDIVKPSLTQKEALAAASQTANGFFRVPRTVEN